jgi:uncharacterized protein
MKPIFFLLVFCFLLLVTGYVVLRGWQIIPAKGFWRVGFLAGNIIGLILFLSGILLEHKLGLTFGKGVAFLGFSYFLVLIYWLISFIVIDEIRLINYFFHFSSDNLFVFRQWAGVFSVFIIVIAMIIGNYKFNHPTLVRKDITIEKPFIQKELKVVLASDIPLGNSIDKIRLKKYVDLINSRNPDLILLAGDITDRSFAPVAEQNMKDELALLEAPMGVFAISGNHEYYSGIPDSIAHYLELAGITVLKDSVALVEHGLYIIGRDDRSNPHRKSLKAIVKGLNPALPLILLDHQPYHLEEAEANLIDLQLSGHTHNGQFFPGNLLVKRVFEQAHGYLKKGKTHYYISSGLGIWGPHYRIGTQSELVELYLHFQ